MTDQASPIDYRRRQQLSRIGQRLIILFGSLLLALYALAPVTWLVSLTAIPAQWPKNVSLKPSAWPISG